MKFHVEYTDTFGGEANYSWVRRETIEVPGDAKQSLVIKRAKASIGITGVRGKVVDIGAGYEFRPYKYCTVMFVTAEY